jgi:hypothetical protein
VQTERQSIITYHKQFEEAKGQVTSVADDVSMRNSASVQKGVSLNSYRQTATVRVSLCRVATLVLDFLGSLWIQVPRSTDTPAASSSPTLARLDPVVTGVAHPKPATITSGLPLKQTTHSCIICFDDMEDKGVRCKSNHFTCDGCFDEQVKSIATATNRLAIGATVKCCNPSCDAKPFETRTIATHVLDQTFNLLNTLIIDLKEAKIVADNEKRLQDAMEQKRKRIEQMTTREREIDDCRKHIEEDVLTLKCPRCLAAFSDFSGCFALTCERCNCGFCAWCLTDCGSDAHSCAAKCGSLYGGGGVFGSQDEFNGHHDKRRQQAQEAYLATLPAGIRDDVVNKLPRPVAW